MLDGGESLEDPSNDRGDSTGSRELSDVGETVIGMNDECPRLDI